MTTLQSPEESLVTEGILSKNDRCDSCGAQAYVRVKVQSGELFFCAHHAHEVEPTLKPLSLEWIDESAALLSE